MTEPMGEDRYVLKELLSGEQNHRCCLCGIRMGYFGDWQRYPTFEHVVPRVFGGRFEYENLVISCSECNCKRGAPVTRDILQICKSCP